MIVTKSCLWHGNETEESRMLMPRLLGPLSIQEMPLPRKSSHYSNDIISKTVMRKPYRFVIDALSDIQNNNTNVINGL